MGPNILTCVGGVGGAVVGFFIGGGHGAGAGAALGSTLGTRVWKITTAMEQNRSREALVRITKHYLIKSALYVGAYLSYPSIKGRIEDIYCSDPNSASCSTAQWINSGASTLAVGSLVVYEVNNFFQAMVKKTEALLSPAALVQRLQPVIETARQIGTEASQASQNLGRASANDVETIIHASTEMTHASIQDIQSL